MITKDNPESHKILQYNPDMLSTLYPSMILQTASVLYSINGQEAWSNSRLTKPMSMPADHSAFVSQLHTSTYCTVKPILRDHLS